MKLKKSYEQRVELNIGNCVYNARGQRFSLRIRWNDGLAVLLFTEGDFVRHINYLKYVLRHKWFVFVASWRLGVPLLAAILHDASKFLPSEWLPYAWTFYAEDGSKQYKETLAFAQAWNDHQKRNGHHWQRWLITWDRGTTEPLPMPRRYIMEMVADWMGAGRAITGKWEAGEWYEKNKATILLHHDTRAEIEILLNCVFCKQEKT